MSHLRGVFDLKNYFLKFDFLKALLFPPKVCSEMEMAGRLF
jgi:hypothetical protein